PAGVEGAHVDARARGVAIERHAVVAEQVLRGAAAVDIGADLRDELGAALHHPLAGVEAGVGREDRLQELPAAQVDRLRVAVEQLGDLRAVLAGFRHASLLAAPAPGAAVARSLVRASGARERAAGAAAAATLARPGARGDDRPVRDGLLRWTVGDVRITCV